MNQQETQQWAFDALVSVGAIVYGHFVYRSGMHGDTYVNKDAIYPHTRVTSQICRAIADQFANLQIDTVVAPEKGGIILSQWVADHLSNIRGHQVHAVYAEKLEGGFVFTRGYQKYVTDKGVLVVEDVLTTGGSAKKVVDLTRAAGGNVLSLGVIWNRGSVNLEVVGNPPTLYSLINITLDSWNEDDCKHTGPCSKNIPINTEIGAGKALSTQQK